MRKQDFFVDSCLSPFLISLSVKLRGFTGEAEDD